MFETGMTTAGMRFVEGGEFTMGSRAFYPEEAPLRRVRVDSFWIDETPVTNRDFASFVAATGHITQAETAPDPRDYPDMLPGMDRAGSLVFNKTAGPVALSDFHLWWSFTFEAFWKYPFGPEFSIDELDMWDHPVVHVAWGDAVAYAKWAGKSLPSEAEFEFAARGGLDGCEYAWGDELAPGGAMLANYWQGLFPFSNTRLDGWERTSPVRTYPANGFGIYDMIGNVWEWTNDWWSIPEAIAKKSRQSCCTISNPRGGRLRSSIDKMQGGPHMGRKVLKGGSHLCAQNHCMRYRPAARHPETVDTSTSHIGFRCVIRPS